MICCEKTTLALEAVECVFALALDRKSKCLIQACVMNAEREFSGVSSFREKTQLKFLMESVLHIIEDNCQKEYIHILHYLESMNARIPDITCQEEFTRSMLKLKQLFILYNILENGMASNICFLLDDLFPPDDLLRGMLINKMAAKKRFLSSTRREIKSFKRLVNKLLTDMEYRQYYFFEECFHDFGETCHKELLSDITTYLTDVEQRLVRDENNESISKRWEKLDVSRNPALLYFFKILTDMGENLTEIEVLSFLKWMFPSFDETILTMPATSRLKGPGIFSKQHFENILSKATCVLQEHPPWKFDNFTEAWNEMQKSQLPATTIKSESREDVDRTNIFTNSNCATQCLRVVLSDISSQITNNGFSENTSSMRTPENNLRSPREKISLSNFDTPHSKKLLASGSKFFSPERNIVRDDTPLQLSSEILDTAPRVNFSDDEMESDTVNQLSSLQWVNLSTTIGSTPKSKSFNSSKSCRSLSFQYASSDDIISESDVEEDKKRQTQPCVQMLDNSYVPDLSWCLNDPRVRPCTIKLRRLNDLITKDGTVDGIRIRASNHVVRSRKSHV